MNKFLTLTKVNVIAFFKIEIVLMHSHMQLYKDLVISLDAFHLLPSYYELIKINFFNFILHEPCSSPRSHTPVQKGSTK